MKIIVKCDRIYFPGEKNRKILSNRHGNLIFAPVAASPPASAGKMNAPTFGRDVAPLGG